MGSKRSRSEERIARAAERRDLRRLPRTKLGIAAGVMALVFAPLVVYLTSESVEAIQRTYGVRARESSPFLLTYIIGASLALGAIGLLLPKAWGWWLTLVAAALGPLDLLRIYRRLYASINFDHPDVNRVIGELSFGAGLPATLYLALLGVLLLRKMRADYRVTGLATEARRELR